MDVQSSGSATKRRGVRFGGGSGVLASRSGRAAELRAALASHQGSYRRVGRMAADCRMERSVWVSRPARIGWVSRLERDWPGLSFALGCTGVSRSVVRGGLRGCVSGCRAGTWWAWVVGCALVLMGLRCRSEQHTGCKAVWQLTCSDTQNGGSSSCGPPSRPSTAVTVSIGRVLPRGGDDRSRLPRTCGWPPC
jgi:hypothetical protein